jgi:hypothetical protein
MERSDEVELWRASRQDEVDSAFDYRALVEHRSGESSTRGPEGERDELTALYVAGCFRTSAWVTARSGGRERPKSVPVPSDGLRRARRE